MVFRWKYLTIIFRNLRKVSMSDQEQPIEPVRPSEQPGTPIRKSPDSVPIQPVRPSESTGTSIPCSEK